MVKIEADGDLHIFLADARGDKPGIVVAEIPAKAEWCDLRKIVFSWTQVEFPFRIRSGRELKIAQPPIITVIGKAFFDIGHASADHSNQRTDLQGYTAGEIPSRHETDSSVIRKHETGFASLQPFRGYSLYGGGNRLQVAV